MLMERRTTALVVIGCGKFALFFKVSTGNDLHFAGHFVGASSKW